MWKRERYLVAKGDGLANVDGITAKGLGMSIVRPHVIFAQAAITAIHHLGSGHLLCYVELKGIDEISFVDTKPDPRKTDLDLKLEILKHVIEAKKEAIATAEKAAQTAERKRKLMAALDSKETADLAGMTTEQIRAEIEKLGA